MYYFFFFQAEDGIRDKLVTGVQTCALPISMAEKGSTSGDFHFFASTEPSAQLKEARIRLSEAHSCDRPNEPVAIRSGQSKTAKPTTPSPSPAFPRDAMW